MAGDSQDTARNSLLERVIPTMTLSTQANPLTAPLPINNLSIAERIAKRFSVEGNVIGMSYILRLHAIHDQTQQVPSSPSPSFNIVFIYPGLILFTLIPLLAHSAASDRVRCSTPALLTL
jgi:hypothetical protein